MIKNAWNVHEENTFSRAYYLWYWFIHDILSLIYFHQILQCYNILPYWHCITYFLWCKGFRHDNPLRLLTIQDNSNIRLDSHTGTMDSKGMENWKTCCRSGPDCTLSLPHSSAKKLGHPQSHTRCYYQANGKWSPLFLCIYQFQHLLFQFF